MSLQDLKEPKSLAPAAGPAKPAGELARAKQARGPEQGLGTNLQQMAALAEETGHLAHGLLPAVDTLGLTSG